MRLKLKKIASLSVALLVLVMVSLAGCARQVPREENKKVDEYKPAVNIGLVTPSSSQSGFNLLAGVEVGLNKAVNELGARVNRLEPGELPEDVDRLRYLAENRNDLILVLGNNLASDLVEVAEEFPEAHFALLGGEAQGGNIISVRSRTEEFAYIAGIVAGMITKNNYVSFLGGSEDPAHREEENNFKKGVAYGAKLAGKDVKVEIKYTGFTEKAWNQPEKANEIAAAQYERGVDIIYETAGNSGLGVWQAARDKKGQLISSHPVSSAYKEFSLGEADVKMDTVAFNLVKDEAEGKLKPGARAFGLQENALTVTLTPVLPENVRTTVNGVMEEIKKGKIKLQ